MTRRITFNSGAPSTEFGLEADLIAQSQAGNYTVVRMYRVAINRGNSGSYSGNQGGHLIQIDNIWGDERTGTLPSGYGTGATRWNDGPYDINVGHDGEGYAPGITLRQRIRGWFSNEQTVGWGYNSWAGRIPKKPTPPGTPTFTEVLPTSVRINFSGSADNRGAAIDGYLVRYWPNPDGTGPYTDFSVENNTSRVVTGLTPGKQYRFVVYAHNGSADNNGFSDVSGATVVRTLSGAWAKYGGQWKRAIPYQKIAGVWTLISPFIKNAGTWKRGG